MEYYPRIPNQEAYTFLSQYHDSELGQRQTQIFNSAFLSPPSSISSRVMNHWIETGLIEDPRNGASGWRMFSPIEMVWMQIVISLRSFNLPLKTIFEVKKCLEHLSDKYPSTMPLLEVYIYRLLSKPTAAYIIVQPNGQTDIGFKEPIQLAQDMGLIGSHIRIDLTDILRRVWPNHERLKEVPFSSDLTIPELELLEFIRTTDCEVINVSTKGGEIKRIEVDEVIKNPNRIHEYANEFSHQDITSVVVDGKIRYVKRKIKKKY